MKIFILVCSLLLAGISSVATGDLDHHGHKSNVLRIQRVSDAISRSRGYSQMVVVDHLKSGVREIQLAGQTFVADGTFEGQTRAVWEGIRILLALAGADFQDIVAVTNALADIRTNIDAFLAIRREVLAGNNNPDTFIYPETSMTIGALLARDFLFVEILVRMATIEIPKNWKVGQLPANTTLEDMVYKNLNISPLDISLVQAV